MKTKEINKLIDRYYAGESSLEEERQLKKYFSGDSISPDLKQHQSLFQGLRQMQNDGLSAGFEARLLDRLETKAPARVLHFQTYLLRIAAVVVLVVGIWFLIPKTETPSDSQSIDWTAYESQLSEEEAMEETIAALRLLSEKLNSGKKKVKSEIRNVDRMNHPMN